jgi:chromosome segregation ATPase
MAKVDINKMSEVELVENIKLAEGEIKRLKDERKELDRKINANALERNELNREITMYRRSLEGHKIRKFKEQLFKNHGGDVPKDKLEKVWEKAWEKGHVYGLNEVGIHFIDLVELFE